MTRTEQSALPSLYEACHEDPYMPASRGFGQWPETKWPWFGELADREGAYALKIHRGKHILVTEQVAALLDPILRSELERMHSEGTTGRSCSTISTPLGRPRSRICARSSGSRRRRSRASRAHSSGAASSSAGHSRSRRRPRGRIRTRRSSPWDQVYPEPSASGGLEDLTVAAVRAAVVAPERQAYRWFSWSWLYRKTLVDDLVAEGRLWRPEPDWVSAVETASG